MKNFHTTLGSKSKLANMLGRNSPSESPRSPNFDSARSKPKVALPKLSIQTSQKQHRSKTITHEELSAMLPTATSMNNQAFRIRTNSIGQVVLTEPNFVQYSPHHGNFSNFLLTENSEAPFSDGLRTLKNSPLISNFDLDTPSANILLQNKQQTKHQKSQSSARQSQIASPTSLPSHTKNSSLSTRVQDEANFFSPIKTTKGKVPLKKIQSEKKGDKFMSPIKPFDASVYTTPPNNKATSPRLSKIVIKSPKSEPRRLPAQQIPALSEQKFENMNKVYKKPSLFHKIDQKKTVKVQSKTAKTPKNEDKKEDEEEEKVENVEKVEEQQEQQQVIKEEQEETKEEERQPSLLLKLTTLESDPKTNLMPTNFVEFDPQKIGLPSPILPTENNNPDNLITPFDRPVSDVQGNHNYFAFPEIESFFPGKEASPFHPSNSGSPFSLPTDQEVGFDLAMMMSSPSIDVIHHQLPEMANQEPKEFPVLNPRIDENNEKPTINIVPDSKTGSPDNNTVTTNTSSKVNPESPRQSKGILTLTRQPSDRKKKNITLKIENSNFNLISKEEGQQHEEQQQEEKRKEEKKQEEKVRFDEILISPVHHKPDVQMIMKQIDAPISPLFNISENSREGETMIMEEPLSSQQKVPSKSKFSETRKTKRLIDSIPQIPSRSRIETPYFEEEKVQPQVENKEAALTTRSIHSVHSVPSNLNKQGAVFLNGFDTNSMSSITSNDSSPKNRNMFSKSSILRLSEPLKEGAHGRRRMSLFRSVIKEEEQISLSASFEAPEQGGGGRRNSISFERRKSGSSLDNQSLLPVRRKSGSNRSSQELRASIFKSEKKVAPIIPNLEDSTVAPLTPGVKTKKLYPPNKGPMLKAHSTRQMFSFAKKKKVIELDQGDFKAKLDFKKPKFAYKKNGDFATRASQMFNEDKATYFLKKLNSFGFDMKEETSPFAGKSMNAESRDVTGGKNPIVDFSTLLKHYDEHSPISVDPRIQKMKQPITPRSLGGKLNPPVRRETKIMINIVPPSALQKEAAEDAFTVQEEKQTKAANKGKQFEFFLKSDNRRPSLLEQEFSLFEDFENFEAKDFPTEIYMGETQLLNKKVVWNFSSYFAFDNNKMDFFKYYEQIVQKKFPFLLSSCEIGLCKYEETLIGQTKDNKVEFPKSDLQLKAILFDIVVQRSSNVYEEQRIMKEILSNVYAHHVFKRRNSLEGGATSAELPSPHIEDLESLETEMVRLNIQISLPRQATQVQITKCTPFHKNIILNSLPETIFDKVFKQDYLNFDHYLALDDLRIPTLASDLVLLSYNTTYGKNPVNLEYISKLIFKHYEKQLQGTFGHDYYIRDVVPKAVKSVPAFHTLDVKSPRSKKILKTSKSNVETITKTLTFENPVKAKPKHISSKSVSQNAKLLTTSPTLENTKDPNRLRINKTLTIYENKEEPMISNFEQIEQNEVVRHKGGHDLNKVTTLPEKSEHASSQSSKYYDNFQKISTAPSEFLQIPSKTFLSDEPNNPSYQNLNTLKEPSKESKTKSLNPTKKLRSFVSKNLIKAPSKVPSENHLAPSITLTKEENQSQNHNHNPNPKGKMADMLLKQAVQKIIQPIREKRITIIKPKEEGRLSIQLSPGMIQGKDRAVMRSTGTYQNRKRSSNPVEQFFIYVRENRTTELEEFFLTYTFILVDSIDENGNSPLCIAAQSGFVDVAVLLVQKGANLNIQNVDGNTALHLALAYSHYALADRLISAGASQNLHNKNGKTPWELVL